jgi:hypothetical protein
MAPRARQSASNLVHGVPIYLNTGDKTQWLNPAAFALPGIGELGSLGKGSIRGRPITNLDFSENKNWTFKEKYQIQFRAEMFNVFNHPNFANQAGYQNGLNFKGQYYAVELRTPTNGAFGTISQASTGRSSSDSSLLSDILASRPKPERRAELFLIQPSVSALQICP